MHALVQDAGDKNASTFLPVKGDLPASLHAANAEVNLIAWPAETGFRGEHPATGLKVVHVNE